MTVISVIFRISDRSRSNFRLLRYCSGCQQGRSCCVCICICHLGIQDIRHQVRVSPLFSWIIDAIRIPMLVGRLITLAACVMYIFVEFIPVNRRWWMFSCYLLIGIGFGEWITRLNATRMSTQVHPLFSVHISLVILRKRIDQLRMHYRMELECCLWLSDLVSYPHMHFIQVTIAFQ